MTMRYVDIEIAELASSKGLVLWRQTSAKAEAGGALVQRKHEALAQQLLALVLHQVQLVEAGVCGRQLLLAPVRLVDLELLRPADALCSINMQFLRAQPRSIQKPGAASPEAQAAKSCSTLIADQAWKPA